MQEAPVFAQGDLLIAFPRGILAAISVKTTFRRDEVEKAVEGLNSVRAVAQSTGLDAAAIWCGAYFYTGPKPFLAETAYEWIVDAIRRAPFADPPLDHGRAHPLGPDVIALADDELFRVDYGLDGMKSIRAR